jgi:iron complex transport system ATP-binding protein
VLAQIWNDRPGPPAYLLLDEPTASLDLAHQYDCLSQARAFADRGGGVLAVLHDPNQAMAFADRVSLLRSGELIASGPPADVLTAERLSELYGIRVEVAQTREGARPYIVVSRSW